MRDSALEWCGQAPGASSPVGHTAPGSLPLRQRGPAYTRRRERGTVGRPAPLTRCRLVAKPRQRWCGTGIVVIGH